MRTILEEKTSDEPSGVDVDERHAILNAHAGDHVEQPVEEPIAEQQPVEELIGEQQPVEEPIGEQQPVEEHQPVEEPMGEQQPVEEHQPVEEGLGGEEPVHESTVEDQPGNKPDPTPQQSLSQGIWPINFPFLNFIRIAQYSNLLRTCAILGTGAETGAIPLVIGSAVIGPAEEVKCGQGVDVDMPLPLYLPGGLPDHLQHLQVLHKIG